MKALLFVGISLLSTLALAQDKAAYSICKEGVEPSAKVSFQKTKKFVDAAKALEASNSKVFDNLMSEIKSNEKAWASALESFSFNRSDEVAATVDLKNLIMQDKKPFDVLYPFLSRASIRFDTKEDYIEVKYCDSNFQVETKYVGIGKTENRGVKLCSTMTIKQSGRGVYMDHGKYEPGDSRYVKGLQTYDETVFGKHNVSVTSMEGFPLMYNESEFVTVSVLKACGRDPSAKKEHIWGSALAINSEDRTSGKDSSYEDPFNKKSGSGAIKQ